MLVVEKGIPELRVIPLEQQVYWLGASSSADVFIENSYVSRMHAQIVEEADGHRIRDLGSKNEIAAAGWPERTDGDVGDQEIEQSIRRIRLRIEPQPSKPRHIINVRGYGYKLSQR